MFAFLPPGLPVFVATTPGKGGKLKQRLSASRESHPSEVLSELPPLFETVAGQEYHCVLTRSLRNSLSLFYGRMGTARRLAWPSLMGISPTGGSWRILQSRFTLVRRFVRERISVAGCDRRTDRRCFSRCRGRHHRHPQEKENWSRILFITTKSLPSRVAFTRWSSSSCSGDSVLAWG